MTPKPSQALVPVQPVIETAQALELRDYAVAVRDVLSTMSSDQLETLETVLGAVSRRLQQISRDASEAEKSRVLVLQQVGALLGERSPGRRNDLSASDDRLSHSERDRRYAERLLFEYPTVVTAELSKPKVTLNQVVRACKLQRAEELKIAAVELVPVIEQANALTWLAEQDDCDLLLTDPPYSTDVEDIYAFAAEWLPLALAKVKPTGRAYVCIGAYPAELHAYLSVPTGDLTLANVLVWTYRNTLGPTPTLDYKLNWQAILYYRGPEAPPLDSPKMTEQFSVADINAPDGRQGDRLHAWQKPFDLAERFIRHATQPGQLVLDPFAGTGTFLIAAGRLGRVARGCDLDEEMLQFAEGRGCRRG